MNQRPKFHVHLYFQFNLLDKADAVSGSGLQKGKCNYDIFSLNQNEANILPPNFTLTDPSISCRERRKSCILFSCEK